MYVISFLIIIVSYLTRSLVTLDFWQLQAQMQQVEFRKVDDKICRASRKLA